MTDKNKNVEQSLEDSFDLNKSEPSTDGKETVVVEQHAETSQTSEVSRRLDAEDKETAPAKTGFSRSAKAVAFIVAAALALIVIIGALVTNAQPSRPEKLSAPTQPFSETAKPAAGNAQTIPVIEPNRLSCFKCPPESLTFDHVKGTTTCPIDCSAYEYDKPTNE